MDPLREMAWESPVEWEIRAQWSLDKSRSRRDAERIAAERRERRRREDMWVWLVTAALFAFIALALWCGPLGA